MASNLHLDHAGLMAALEQRGVIDAVDKMAEKVAERVRAQGITVGDRDGGSHEYPLPVEASQYHSDRPRASVTIKHPAGLAVQAKHGALSKAAADCGLELNG